MAGREFVPGDTFRKTQGGRYRVCDPPRTSHGKLRFERIDDDGTATTHVQTAWWKTTASLPRRYSMDAR